MTHLESQDLAAQLSLYQEFIDSLKAEALMAMGNSYSPYSHLKVGAALLTRERQIFRGCNVENMAFGETICAEATALVSMHAQVGRKAIDLIALTSSGQELITPCGGCRQKLIEFGHAGTLIMSFQPTEYTLFSLNELMPEAFRF